MAKNEQNPLEAADLIPVRSEDFSLLSRSAQNPLEAADPIPSELTVLPVYRVVSPVEHGTNAVDQRRYEPGDSIALTDAHAAPLLACGAVEIEV